jgi:peptide-methionine (S)-S-oxide reductase
MSSKAAKAGDASFAAGCFWGVEEAFRCVKGVVETEVGYMGGTTKNPTYEEVCTGKTGHAETVHLKFDPKTISYGELLDIFWSIHDPTQLNRQGPDFGSNYRSIIFYHSPEQRKLAVASRERLEKSGKYGGRIVTEIIPAAVFWRAEEYHQKYEMKTGKKVC